MQFTTAEIILLLLCLITLTVSIITLITVFKKNSNNKAEDELQKYCSISRALHSHKMTERFSLNKDFTAFRQATLRALKISDARLMKSLKV